MKNQKIALVILDGWGLGTVPSADAIRQATTPFTDSLYSKYPNSTLITFGEEVGLPEDQMGNSEVGHLNIGAGRVVYQELARINKAIKDNTLRNQQNIQQLITSAKEENKRIHLLGLLSDGGVHSHINHLKALVKILEGEGLDNIFIHGFLDGRDCSPTSGVDFISDLEGFLKDKKSKLATLIGRYYAMDRDKRWERVKKSYDLIVKNIGKKSYDIIGDIKESYANKITDEFLEPHLLVNNSEINSGDIVLFFNFRTDRPRQLTEVFTQKSIEEHSLHIIDNLEYYTMTMYNENYRDINVIFTKDEMKNTMGEVLSNLGKTQVRIAETEKFPHVSFFFSGGKENEFSGEKRILIPSPKVATYDLQPEMSAPQVADAIVNEIEANQPDFICLNFANADMVGHTGIFSAAMIAVQTVDSCLEKVVNMGLKYDYEFIIIADHGNSDFMINADGSPNTAHTTNLVPIFFVSNNVNGRSIKHGKLGDIAPTLLNLAGIVPPKEMDGINLIN